MRIVGGRLKGRGLTGPRSDSIRPTSDRLREAVFNILAHGEYADILSGSRVMDLFAGTGAMGIEALSRGAGFALLVDDGAEARGLIRQNVEALGLGGVTRLFRRDATRMGAVHPNEPFGLVFCDPPYGKGLGERALASCLEGGWLAPGTILVAEEAADAGFALPAGLAELDRRRYGETEIVFGRYEGQAPEA